MEIESNGYYDINTNGAQLLPLHVNVFSDGARIEQTKVVNIVQNGSVTVSPEQDYDGIKDVVINTSVPTSVNVQKDKNVVITNNGVNTVVPDSGYDCMSSVIVNTQVSTSESEREKTIDVTNNGKYTVTPTAPYASMKLVNINVNVPTKTIQPPAYFTQTENNLYVYTPEVGYDGFSSLSIRTDVKIQQLKLFTVGGVEIAGENINTAIYDKVNVPLDYGVLYNYKNEHSTFVLVVNVGVVTLNVPNVYKYVAFPLYDEDDDGNRSFIDNGQLRFEGQLNGVSKSIFVTLFESIPKYGNFYFNMKNLNIDYSVMD